MRFVCRFVEKKKNFKKLLDALGGINVPSYSESNVLEHFIIYKNVSFYAELSFSLGRFSHSLSTYAKTTTIFDTATHVEGLKK